MSIETKLKQLKAAPLHGTLKALVTELRDKEREQFENMPASEYGRGRLSILNELLTAL